MDVPEQTSEREREIPGWKFEEPIRLAGGPCSDNLNYNFLLSGRSHTKSTENAGPEHP